MAIARLVAHNNKIASQALRKLFKKDPPDLDLPFMHGDEDGRGGPPVSDPVTFFSVCLLRQGTRIPMA